MSETLATPNASFATSPHAFSWIQLLLILVPYVALYAVAIWLVAMTDSDPAQASPLWERFMPADGLIGVVEGLPVSDGRPLLDRQHEPPWERQGPCADRALLPPLEG